MSRSMQGRIEAARTASESPIPCPGCGKAYYPVSSGGGKGYKTTYYSCSGCGLQWLAVERAMYILPEDTWEWEPIEDLVEVDLTRVGKPIKKIIVESGETFEARDGDLVTAYEDSMVYAHAGSKVFAKANSETYAYEGAEVHAGIKSLVYAYPGAIIREIGGEVIQMSRDEEPTDE